jgi:hypothetical protein
MVGSTTYYILHSVINMRVYKKLRISIYQFLLLLLNVKMSNQNKIGMK